MQAHLRSGIRKPGVRLPPLTAGSQKRQQTRHRRRFFDSCPESPGTYVPGLSAFSECRSCTSARKCLVFFQDRSARRRRRTPRRLSFATSAEISCYDNASFVFVRSCSWRRVGLDKETGIDIGRCCLPANRLGQSTADARTLLTADDDLGTLHLAHEEPFDSPGRMVGTGIPTQGASSSTRTIVAFDQLHFICPSRHARGSPACGASPS